MGLRWETKETRTERQYRVAFWSDRQGWRAHIMYMLPDGNFNYPAGIEVYSPRPLRGGREFAGSWRPYPFKNISVDSNDEAELERILLREIARAKRRVNPAVRKSRR